MQESYFQTSRPQRPEKVTLAENIPSSRWRTEGIKSTGRSTDGANLKKCEIKQLPNCWPENLSRYPVSLSYRLSCCLILRLHPHLSPGAFPLPILAVENRRHLARRDHLSRERFPRPPPLQFTLNSLVGSDDMTYSSAVALLHAPILSLVPLITLPLFHSSYTFRGIHSRKDLRSDTTETSAGSQLRDYPPDLFRSVVPQIPFPTEYV